MKKLMGLDKDGSGSNSMGRRLKIARSMTEGVKASLPYMNGSIEWAPTVAQKTENIPLSRRLLGPDDLATADKETAEWKPKYEQMLVEIKANPDKTKEKRWFTAITIPHTRYRRGRSVHERYESEKRNPKLPVEVKVIR